MIRREHSGGEPSKRASVFAVGIAALVSACSSESEEPAERADRTGDTRGVDTPAPAPSTPQFDPDGIVRLERGERLDDPFAERFERLDPRVDGSRVEVFNELAGNQLGVLARAIETPDEVGDDELGAILAQDFALAPLRPDNVGPVFQGAAFDVQRASQRDGLEPAGVAALRQAIASLSEGAGELHVKLKTFRVDDREGGVESTVLYQAYGSGQQTAHWTCGWAWDGSDEPPLLRSIRPTSFDEVSTPGGGRWRDCTESVLAVPAFESDLLPGLNRWRGSLDAALGIKLFGHQGLAVGDADSDGLDDLYVCMSGGVANRLFLQKPDGSVTDASADAGLDHLDNTHSALFVDFDNDGDQDLVITTDALVFFQNDGAARFTPELRLNDPRGFTSLAAADADSDGDLDLYVSCYDMADVNAPDPYHDANNGPPNLFLRNESAGDGWRFVDATVESGFDQNNRRFSFAASWEDYDNDGDQDLYVANDFGRNNLYRNDGGKFTDVAAEAGVEDISAGMAATWADYDNDGRMDVYVSNMFSTAGNRVTYQRSFQSEAAEDTKEHFQRHARGNSLFRNSGDGTFLDVSLDEGVTMGRWAWGSKFVDMNNDGWEDLVVANGFLTNENPDDL